MDYATALSELQSQFNALLATKYLAAAGLVCVLWDHLLTLSEEYALIWARPKWDFTTMLFALNRYGVEAALMYVAYILSGFHPALDNTTCKVFILIIGVIAILSITLANVYTVLRVYSLWDQRKRAMYALLTAFVACYGTMFVMFGFALNSLFIHALYSPFVSTCVFPIKPPTYVGVWASMVAFDVFTLSLVIFNTLDRPHRQRHGIQLLDDLNRDGAIFNLILFLIRLLNFILALTSGAADMFLGIFFIWALISITMSRLILRVEALKASALVQSWVTMSIMQMYEMPDSVAHSHSK